MKREPHAVASGRDHDAARGESGEGGGGVV